jgi:hypothetical protein
MFARIARVYAQEMERSPFRTQVGLSTTIAVVGDVTCQVVFGSGRRAAESGDKRQPPHEEGAVASATSPAAAARPPADNDYDGERTARFGLVRMCQFCVMVPWLSMLERRVRFVGGPPLLTVATKIALDQLVWTPPSMCAFYTSMAVLEGGSLADGVARASRMLWPTLQVNWPFWTGAWRWPMHHSRAGAAGNVWCWCRRRLIPLVDLLLGLARVGSLSAGAAFVPRSCPAGIHCLTFTVVPVHLRMIWISTIMVGWNAFLSHLNQKDSRSQSSERR